jgi:hypothetical protein
MRGRKNAIAAGLLSAALLVASAGSTRAGFPEDWEPLVFELTLAGDIDLDDTFGVAHACDDTPECAFVEDRSIFCSGNRELRDTWGYRVCRVGTFTIELAGQSGVTVDYALVRFVDSAFGEPIDLLPGAVTIPVGGITIHLGYDYSKTAPALPDTAMSAP